MEFLMFHPIVYQDSNDSCHCVFAYMYVHFITYTYILNPTENATFHFIFGPKQNMKR